MLESGQLDIAQVREVSIPFAGEAYLGVFWEFATGNRCIDPEDVPVHSNVDELG